MDIKWMLNEYKNLKDKPNRTQHEEGQLYILKFIADIAKESSMIIDHEVLQKLIEVVNFYGSPETYLAISYLPDRPCGDLMEDFSDTGVFGRKPGKKAREASEFIMAHKSGFAQKYNDILAEKYLNPESGEEDE